MRNSVFKLANFVIAVSFSALLMGMWIGNFSGNIFQCNGGRSLTVLQVDQASRKVKAELVFTGSSGGYSMIVSNGFFPIIISEK
ncbi:MAG: hypothetical protein IT223_12460 [Crocinitomicaceae bacterium]|nr:hypothetical protein [Crocinitomicaceae bacterium]